MGENIKCGLIGELMEGEEIAKKLYDQISPSSSPSSSTTSSSSSSSPLDFANGVLIDKILLSFEKALTMVKGNVGKIKTNNVNMMDSHCSNGSPKSEVQDSMFKHKHASKKRKTNPKWTEQVKVYLGTAPEGTVEDGYSWRKYGQKDIHGAKFPRGYYRCTHRNSQGCLATKQVQKSEEDSMVYEITYKGRHTCTQSSHLNKAHPSKKLKFGQNKSQPQEEKIQPQEEKIQPSLEKTFSFDNKEEIFPSFNFSSPSIGSENEDNNMFLETMIKNNFMENENNNIFSESNNFCLSLLDLDNIELSPSESLLDLDSIELSPSELISGPNSVVNSPIDFDFFNGINCDVDYL